MQDRWSNVPPRYNGAPSQDLWIIRRNPTTGERTLDLLRWGLIPHFCAERPKPPPINGAAETLSSKTFPPEERPFFADAYRRRRCIMPIDGFFEWKAVKGEKAKQPFAIAMKDGSPFGLGALWENWRDPKAASGCAPFASSPRAPIRSCARSTAACRSSCSPRIMPAGCPTRRIRASFSNRLLPSR
jgi:putative SOS response-associated peptidase YedK